MPKIEINVPDTFTLSIGGESKHFKTEDVPTSTWEHFLWTGAARVGSYSYTSAKAAACKTDDGKTDETRWTRDLHEKQVAAVYDRIINGDWSRTGTRAPTDPVADLAMKMARDQITMRFAAAAGLGKDGALPRMATIRDNLPKEARDKLARFGEFSGKSGNTFTWDNDTVAAYVEKQGLRDAAQKELVKRAKMAEQVDLDDLDI